MRQLRRVGLLMAALLLSPAGALASQAAARPLPSWDAEELLPSATGTQRWAADVGPGKQVSLRTRSHTVTGLLVGAVVGVAATTVFLIGFCDDPDTQCGIDEVGRALVIIAVPAAAVGALIGSLIRTED
jgi:hypothetical protein